MKIQYLFTHDNLDTETTYHYFEITTHNKPKNVILKEHGTDRVCYYKNNKLCDFVVSSSVLKYVDNNNIESCQNQIY